MSKANPIFKRETVLASLTRDKRGHTPFIPIALLDLPFDDYRDPKPIKNPGPKAEVPIV